MRSTGLLLKFRLQAPNLVHKCKTSHRHSTISPVRHKGNEFLLDINKKAHRACMVLVQIGTLRITLASANRVGANLKIVHSTVNTDTVFLHIPINKGNNVTPLG